MKRTGLSAAWLATAAVLWFWSTDCGASPARTSPGDRGGRPAPEFPTRDPASWINSPPLSMSDLRGRVVLVDVWTYG